MEMTQALAFAIGSDKPIGRDVAPPLAARGSMPSLDSRNRTGNAEPVDAVAGDHVHRWTSLGLAFSATPESSGILSADESYKIPCLHCHCKAGRNIFWLAPTKSAITSASAYYICLRRNAC